MSESADPPLVPPCRPRVLHWHTAMPPVLHAWRPIEGLADPAAVAAPEMRAFTKLWQRQRQHLAELEVLELFQERLARRWSIETGVLERLYDLSRGLTVTLVERGFHASLVAHGDATIDGERLIEILEDHREGLAMVMDMIRGERPFTTGWIKELHALFTRHQTTTDAITPTGQRIQVPLVRGAYKPRPNNPLRRDGLVHEYCPPEHVSAEMERLIEIYHALPPELPEVRAAWLHHRFTQIHPFQDGNGRVARALASFEFIRGGLLPLLVEREDRDIDYVPALEAADAGDLKPLVTFFADSMSRVLMTASAEADALVSSKRDFRAALRAGRKKVETRLGHAAEARARVTRTFAKVSATLRECFDALLVDIRAENPHIRADLFVPTEEQDHWFRFQIGQLARRRGYQLDVGGARTWIRLRLQSSANQSQTDIVATLHRLGGAAVGTWVCDVFMQHKEMTAPEDQPDLVFLEVDPLMLTVDEDEPDQLARIERWFDQMKVQAAAQWIQFL